MSKRWGLRKSTFLKLLRPALGLTFAFVLLQFKMDSLESIFFDYRLKLRPSPKPSGQIELVLMDQKTVEHAKGIPSFDHHRLALAELVKQNPKAIVYVTPLTQEGDSEDDLARAQSSPSGLAQEREALLEFIKTTRESIPIYQLTDKMALKGEAEALNLPPPFDTIPVLSAPKTADLNLFAADGVTRRVMVDYSGEILGHAFLAGLIDPQRADLKQIRGQFDVYETRQVFIDFLKPGKLSLTKFEGLLRSEIPEGKFTNKIVLIGDDFGKTLKNYIRTPFSRDPSAMTYLEMHGNMLETFIKNSAPIPAPKWLNWLITSLISILTINAVLTMRPLRGIASMLVMALTLCLVAYLLFWLTGLMILVAHPMLAIFLCYYFFIPYRLIIENRRNWEFQQKHELLRQVEELKTNFISMMSHDLKTPIARIQGMTEVIVRDSVVLSSQQREAIDHIRASGEDLLKFVDSTLNYAKIESEGVVLHRESKDINELIKEVVHRSEFLAKAKNIQVKTELEPLFSISVDPALIKQVLSNLIENAIKYSPNDSKILISSEEQDGYVTVQVADQGPGIPEDELPNVFMKFFRSRNAKNSSVKGSGLGLYLAKYFIELHQGRIGVESSVGQGSTFTIELPLQLK